MPARHVLEGVRQQPAYNLSHVLGQGPDRSTVAVAAVVVVLAAAADYSHQIVVALGS